MINTPARIYSPGYLYHDGIGIYVDADGYLHPNQAPSGAETSDEMTDEEKTLAEKIEEVTAERDAIVERMGEKLEETAKILEKGSQS